MASLSMPSVSTIEIVFVHSVKFALSMGAAYLVASVLSFVLWSWLSWLLAIVGGIAIVRRYDAPITTKARGLFAAIRTKLEG